MNRAEIGVLTLAYGNQKYIEMSKTLVRSIKVNSPQISCAVVTDCDLDPEINDLFDIIIPLNREYGTNVRQKLYIDLYSPYQRTIFIDCDSIAVRKIDFIFSELNGVKFTVPGDDVFLSKGDNDPFVDVDVVLSHYLLDKIPKFNGGLYYFENCKETRSFFEDAREMLIDSARLGFKEFRGDGAADEPIISVAMARHGFVIYRDCGRMMRTPVGITGRLVLDVMKGVSSFVKYDNHVAPAIVHFCGRLAEHPLYLRDSLRLKTKFTATMGKHTDLSFYERKLRFGFFLYVLVYKCKMLIRLLKNRKLFA